MSIAAAKRRRRQMRMGNKHVAKLGRRVYKVHSAEHSARKLRRQIETLHRIAQNKGKKK